MGDGVGTGLGLNDAVIVEVDGVTADRLSVTGLVNRPEPPNAVTVAVELLPRQVSAGLVTVSGVASGLVTMQSFTELENSVWTS